MNRELRKEANNGFEKDFFKLMNNSVFGKSTENAWRHRGIKIITTERRRNYLVSERNYYTTKLFSESLIAIEMRKIKVKMYKIVNLGLTIIEISKILTYKLWYYYVSGKVKHELRAQIHELRVQTHEFTSSNSRVTSSNSRVTSSNSRVTSSN